MNETGQFRLHRLRYRTYWDAYQAIAFENAELLKKGERPSAAQLAAETAAAAALQKARDELLAAMGRQDS